MYSSGGHWLELTILTHRVKCLQFHDGPVLVSATDDVDDFLLQRLLESLGNGTKRVLLPVVYTDTWLLHTVPYVGTGSISMPVIGYLNS